MGLGFGVCGLGSIVGPLCMESAHFGVKDLEISTLKASVNDVGRAPDKSHCSCCRDQNQPRAQEIGASKSDYFITLKK